MPDLLLELGTEELPSSAVVAGEAQLGAALERLLAEARLPHGSVSTFATPRRLAVLVREVSDRQQATTEERRGPPVDRAMAPDGSFTPAALGFAKTNGVDPNQLERRTTDQGEYVFAVKKLEGKAAADVLPGLLTGAVSGLSFPKAMRWDSSKVRFPRPIRWLVALLDADVLPVSYGDLSAGRQSVGHRVLHPGFVAIDKAADYEEAMEAAGVMARRSARRQAVEMGVQALALQLGNKSGVDSKVNAVVHPKVLDEVTDLVEKPLALLGRFDPAYLDIPHDVIVTAMESHQRYFPLEDERGRLLPAFAVVSNAKATGESAIVAGNERVLRARLEDAKFFFEEDMKVSLRERADKLSEVVFNRKLGTMREKVDRVKALASRVAEWTGADPETVSLAAEVCKADLLTHLVYEFPELQGSVGREYALRDKELGSRPEAAEAIREHYLPRFAGDDLPATKAGIALSLADRIDTLTGYLGVGLMPTGSEDPYALRRAATGFAVVTLTSQAAIPIDEAVSVAHDHYLRQGTELAPLEDAIRDVRGFVSGRAEGLLAQEGIDRMLVEAARTSDWTDLGDFAARARALQAAHGAGLLHPLAVAFERCHNLSKGVSGSKPDEQVFVHDAERNLYAALRRVEAPVREAAAARDYGKALEELRPLTDPVDAFFDRDRGVLVMDPDEQIRANRLALLACVASLFKQIADFSVIIPAQLELDGKT